MSTKNNPGPFDCLAKVGPDEQMFHLIGRDRMAPSLVDLWALARETVGEEKLVVQNARDTASAMRNDLYLWRRREAHVLDLVPIKFLEDIVARRRRQLELSARRSEAIRLQNAAIDPLGHVNGSTIEPKPTEDS